MDNKEGQRNNHTSVTCGRGQMKTKKNEGKGMRVSGLRENEGKRGGKGRTTTRRHFEGVARRQGRSVTHKKKKKHKTNSLPKGFNKHDLNQSMKKVCIPLADQGTYSIVKHTSHD